MPGVVRSVAPEGTRQPLPLLVARRSLRQSPGAKIRATKGWAAAAEPVDYHAVQRGGPLLREPLAGFAEGRSAWRRGGERLALEGPKETG